MELWHNTEDALRSPLEVAAGEQVAVWIGTWPIELGQYVTLKWSATAAGGERREGEAEAVWQYNDSSRGNSYWLAVIGPFEEGVVVEYYPRGESMSGKVTGMKATFVVQPQKGEE